MNIYESESFIGMVKNQELKFNRRGEWNYCYDENHDWYLFCYAPIDPKIKKSLSIAICKKCALVDGGWAKYEEA